MTGIALLFVAIFLNILSLLFISEKDSQTILIRMYYEWMQLIFPGAVYGILLLIVIYLGAVILKQSAILAIKL